MARDKNNDADVGRRGFLGALATLSADAALVAPGTAGTARAETTAESRDRPRQALLRNQPLLRPPPCSSSAKPAQPKNPASPPSPPGSPPPRSTGAFLRSSGIAVGGVAALSAFGAGTIRRAEAGPTNHAEPIEIRKNVCTHCSVGCSVSAEIQNGVWVGQEPVWDSPINRGTHCAKGAATAG